MATIDELRERSASLFTELLEVQTRREPRRRARGVTAVRAPSFSWFEPDDAVAATTMSFRLTAVAATRKTVNRALELALDDVEDEMSRSHPELVRQGFAMFVTHNRDGRRLAKPRTVAAAPGLFSPPSRRGRQRRISFGGASPGLDYWREDALANDHHQHWHEVYPYAGLPPRDFRVWATDTPRASMAAVLEALDPGPDWSSAVAGATVEQLAGHFANVLRQDAMLPPGDPRPRVRDLPPDLYRVLFRLNDRQGELFFYMHAQMLARYDAELLSNGLARVTPFDGQAWRQPIDEGHDPVGMPRFTRREQHQQLPDEWADLLDGLQGDVDEALAAGTLAGGGGGRVAIDRSNIGEAVESVVPQLRALAPDRYRGLHNTGHGVIAALSPQPGGVMRSTLTAIRDQVFWRWHKHVDDLNAAWQETQDAYDFADRPAVVVRNALDGAATAWASPDIVLCRTVDLPEGADVAALGQALFGGDHWDEDFSAGTASAGAVAVPTIAELVTTMGSVPFGGRTVTFLAHEPFTWFVRVENPSGDDLTVTVRAFMAPADEAADRRAWIELDKFLLAVPAGGRVVAARTDTQSAVVKRPVDLNPARVLGGMGPDEDAYCDCGWPYTLLLPRGTTAGAAYRLMVMCTDATVDTVPEQGHCGSMSFCGAVDRYPDTRDMGYPFSRRFGGPGGAAIEDALVALPNAAARTFTVRHA